MTRRTSCLVLAGGVPRRGEPLWEESRGRPKAVIELAGRPMLAWVLEALAESESIGDLVVVGLEPVADIDYPRAIEWVPNAGSLVDNLYAGIDVLLAADPFIERAAYCWSDIPLARGVMLDRFAHKALRYDSDVAAGLARREDTERRFPDVREDWLRLQEGQFQAIDFGFFRPQSAAKVRRDLRALAERRKSALRLALRVGFGLLWRYLRGRLALAELEARLESEFGVRPRVLIAEDPELGLDVDGLVNLEICRRELEARA